jgi:hypothetical protein
MIVAHSLIETHQLHQKGEITFRIVQEIAFVLLGLCGGKDVANAVDVTDAEIDWLLALPDEIDFMHYMGGNVHVCETVEDLQQVTGMDFEFSEKHGRFPDCTEAILPLDDARVLINADGTVDYALLFAATNNAGGPSWFIPRPLFHAAQIDKQIEAHQQFWSKSEAAA